MEKWYIAILVSQGDLFKFQSSVGNVKNCRTFFAERNTDRLLGYRRMILWICYSQCRMYIVQSAANNPWDLLPVASEAYGIFAYFSETARNFNTKFLHIYIQGILLYFKKSNKILLTSTTANRTYRVFGITAERFSHIQKYLHWKPI